MDPKSDSKELTCDSNGGKTTELKVGTQIISTSWLSNRCKGSSFALVYVHTNKGTTI